MHKAGYITALVSFGIGTLILLLYIFTGKPLFQYVGIKYILIAGVVNILMILAALLDGITGKTLMRNLNAIGIMLLNIPIAILYILFAASVDEKMKIVFVNETGKKIEYIEVYRNNEIIKRRENIDRDDEFNIKIKNDTFSINLHYHIEGKNFIDSDIVKFNCDNRAYESTGTYKLGKDNCIWFERLFD